MATQRLIVAVIAGEAAGVVESMFQAWREHPAQPYTAVDRLCQTLRENAASLPVVHFCEWVDGWLMGDKVPGPDAVNGERFSATCLSPEQTLSWADQCGRQFSEQEWLATRLKEAAESWGKLVDRRVIVVIRDVVGPTTLDEEVVESCKVVPGWLSDCCAEGGFPC